jgi:hypothetical protein
VADAARGIGSKLLIADQYGRPYMNILVQRMVPTLDD